MFIPFAADIYDFCRAFCTILPCILHQNALHLAAYCAAFSTKTHYILLKIAPKRVLVAVGLNKNSFCLHVQLSPFGIKTNLRENRFFAARWAVGGQKATFCVKFLTKNYTKRLRRIHVHGQRHVAPTGLQPPTQTDAEHAAHGQWGSIMETQK